jgi:hypothetical protein
MSIVIQEVSTIKTNMGINIFIYKEGGKYLEVESVFHQVDDKVEMEFRMAVRECLVT